MTIRYEDFVRDPENKLRSLLSFLKINCEEINTSLLVKNVSEKSVGRWENNMDKSIIDQVESITSETLNKFGYQRSM